MSRNPPREEGALPRDGSMSSSLMVAWEHDRKTAEDLYPYRVCVAAMDAPWDPRAVWTAAL